MVIFQQGVHHDALRGRQGFSGKYIYIFFSNFYLFIYLFMAGLGLRFCVRAFSSRGKWGPLFIAVRWPLTAAAPPVAEHRLQTRRLSNCGSWAQALRGMWDLPRPGLEPVSPALAGRLSTTAPSGKPPGKYIFILWKLHLAGRTKIRHFNFRNKEKIEIGLSVLRVKNSRHLENSYRLR